MSQVGNGHAEEQRQAAGTAGKADHLSPRGHVGDAVELTSVGQVEITDEATLEDLKTQVSAYRLFFTFYVSKFIV